MSYELKEVEGGTEFTFITENVLPEMETEKYMKQGGDFIVATLKGHIEGRMPFKSRLILFMCWATKPMTPNRCRSENCRSNKLTASQGGRAMRLLKKEATTNRESAPDENRVNDLNYLFGSFV